MNMWCISEPLSMFSASTVFDICPPAGTHRADKLAHAKEKKRCMGQGTKNKGRGEIFVPGIQHEL